MYREMPFFIQIASDMHSKTAFAIHISTVVYSKTPFFMYETSDMYNKTRISSRKLAFRSRRVPCRIVSHPPSSIRTEARKLKADATAALDMAKRKIEKQIVNGE